MNELHSLLKRQLRRFTGETQPFLEEQTDLLRAINDAYWQFDADRRMLEHSLELTSQELLEANVELSSRNTDLEMRVVERTAELSSSEARFRGLFEHAPVSIWEEDFSAARQYIDDLRRAGVVDFSAYFDAHPEAVAGIAARAKIVDVNRTTLEMYQAESKAQLLADLSRVLGPESLAPFKGQLLALARGETSFESETINYTLRGERRVIFLRLTVAPGCEETWARVFVGISDITKRRQAEAALSAERDLLQALMDNIPDTIYFKDTASRFTRINRAQAKVLDVAAPEDAIGKTDLDFFQDSKLARGFYEEEQHIIETGASLINRIEFNPTPDGQPRWFSATKVPIKTPEGRVIAIVGISRDITERKRVDEKLAASEAELRTLFGAMQDVVMVYDREGRYVQIAPTSTDQLYQPPQEMLGKTVFDILPQALAQTIHDAIQEALRTRKLIHVEYVLPLRGGEEEVWKDAAVSPLTQDTVFWIARDITERKRAEEALKESQERFRSLSEAAFEGIMIHDRGIMLNANQAFADLFGFHSPDELIGRNGFEILPLTAESREKIKSNTERSLPGVSEIEVVGRDGSIFPAETQGRDMIYKGRKVRIVAMRDITERKQVEEALRQSEEKYRSLVERLPAITYISAFDEAKTRLYVSPQNEMYLGFSPEEWLADPDLWRNQLHPEHRDRVLAEAAQFYETGEPFISEYCAVSRDGRLVWFHDEAVMVRDAKGQPQYIQGVKVNITERKQAEEAMRESEERFRLIAWATKDAVWDWDLQTNQIWWGEGLQKIFHYSSDTTQMNPEWRLDHIHPEDRAKVDHVIDLALKGGLEFWSKEYRFQRVDGTYADIMDRGYILHDEAGKPHRMIGAMMDVTERKQNEETIRHHNEMLSSLHKITLDLLRYREIDQLLGALVKLSATFLDAPHSEIMLVEGERLVVKAATQSQPRSIGERVSRDGALLSWQAFDTHEPAVLSDYANWPNHQAIYDNFPVHAVADFPILNDDQCLGVLSLGRHKLNYEFNPDQIQYGRLFANLTALVLNNAQLREALREQSMHDPLTGLYNRRYMEEALKQQLSGVTRRQRPLGTIMLDIDHFKRINDTYGHATGDELLRELGQFLKSHIRNEDIACRYGGEEFILIMPDASLEAAYQRAEYLRQEAKSVRVQEAGRSVEGITLSLGVAIYPQHGQTKDAVLRAADAALYRAKQEGRDRVVVAA